MLINEGSQDAVEAAGAETMKMLFARGMNTNQSCQALMSVVAALVAEACRGDRVCLDDTLDRFSKTLRALAIKAFSAPSNAIAGKMAMQSGADEGRKLIDEMLSGESKDGYKTVLVALPKKPGCRVCASQEGVFHTTIVKRRREEKRETLWTVATLCRECCDSDFAQAKLLDILVRQAGTDNRDTE